ncbi:hypothetical protein YC2023_034139 [Brassica napus]|uniref:Uncharacterized protein n=3 Tax=Brassica TaxID=3705 RepID=A0A0D3B026_BRAOL|nr:unnamed protein product [Brassica napus]VDC85493.1 unnamed protein product [Brassica oleracea]
MQEEEAKVPTRLDSKVQEEVMEKTVDTKAATQNKLWFPEKTDAESHNSDVEHDEAVTRKQSYFIGMRGLRSCGEKVVSRITTAIVAYGLCGDSVDIDQVEENISMPWLFKFKQRLCVQARLDSLFTNLLLFLLVQCGKESPFFCVALLEKQDTAANEEQHISEPKIERLLSVVGVTSLCAFLHFRNGSKTFTWRWSKSDYLLIDWGFSTEMYEISGAASQEPQDVHPFLYGLDGDAGSAERLQQFFPSQLHADRAAALQKLVGVLIINKSNIQDNIAESSSSFEDWTFSGKVILGAIIWYMVVLYDSRFSVSLILCHFIDKERASEGIPSILSSRCVLVILILTKDGAVSLSANHLQKLWLSHELTSPLGHVFKPHQVGISSCPNPHSPPRFFFVTLFAIDDSSLFNTPSLPPLFLKQLLQYHTLPLRLPMKELSS